MGITTVRRGSCRGPVFLPLLLGLAGLVLWNPAPAGAIVDGTPARLADYPFFSVVGKGCGGALIRPDRVLTAAHCTEVLTDRTPVRIGPHRIKRIVNLHAILPLHVRELAKMEREFPPPAGDLMLLKLDHPVKGVPLARIATAAENLKAPGTSVTTIGRGASAADGAGQGVFRSGVVEIQPASSCEEQLGTQLLRQWSICTRDPRMADSGYPGPFVSACFGDSGGPLLSGTWAGRRLVGVVSWGPSCGEMRDPEIYANAVAGRSFALAKRPKWAPQAIGLPRIVGRTEVGSRVRCAVRWRVRPDRKLEYSFILDGFQKQASKRNTFRLTAAARGKKVSCDAGGETAGGRGGTPGLAPSRLVR